MTGLVVMDYGKIGLKIHWLSKVTKDTVWDEVKRHGGYRLGKDQGEGWTVDSLMYLK